MRRLILVLLGVGLTGCLSPGATNLYPQAISGSPQAGGGSVKDVPPVFTSFVGSQLSVDNSGGSSEVFTGTIFDSNGEKDFKGALLKVRLTGPLSSTFTHTVTKDETTAPSEPPTFGSDGFKVWSGTPNDGILSFKFTYSYALGTPPGTYTFTPSVTPAGGSEVQGGADLTLVTVFSQVTISSTPVDCQGQPVSSNWGGWNAEPGAQNVESTNFLKIQNTGQKSDATIVLDFTPSAFGGPDSNFTIPISHNVEFAYAETTGTTSPCSLTFNYLPANADGSVTIPFSGLGKIIYVKYRILSLPPVLASQTYTASLTATEI